MARTLVIRYTNENDEPMVHTVQGAIDAAIAEGDKCCPKHGTAVRVYDDEGVTAIRFPYRGPMLSSEEEFYRDESKRGIDPENGDMFWVLMARGELAECMRRAKTHEV